MNEKDIVLALSLYPVGKDKISKYNIAYLENSKNQQERGQTMCILERLLEKMSSKGSLELARHKRGKGNTS